jgi:hypothetical protein
VCAGARGEDDGAMTEKRVAESTQCQLSGNSSVLGERGYIYIAQTYQQCFSTRTVVDNLNTYQQQS